MGETVRRAGDRGRYAAAALVGIAGAALCSPVQADAQSSPYTIALVTSLTGPAGTESVGDPATFVADALEQLAHGPTWFVGDMLRDGANSWGRCRAAMRSR
jgi:hypothetical protein